MAISRFSCALAGLSLLAMACGSTRNDVEKTGTSQQKLTTVTAGANVNVTHKLLNQAEQAIGVDPQDPTRLFIATNSEPANVGAFAAFSTDSGSTWSSSSSAGDANPNDFLIGNSDDSLPSNGGDPTVAFDTFSNLYHGYLAPDQSNVDVLISTDGGATLSTLAQLGSNVDQPTVVTGPGLNGMNGALWVMYTDLGNVVVQGAPVSGLGTANVGAFTAQVQPSVGFFGDIAVGPNGQVAVTGQNGGGSSGNTISVKVDPDGFGPQGFGTASTFTSDVGLFDLIPAQPTAGSPSAAFGTDAEPALAYDRSNGPHRGRLYLVYVIEVPDESNDTDIVLRFSDDDGANWSNELRVNDDTTTNSQWLPRIAVDQTTGNVAVSWHDARNDDGLHGAGDTDGVANNNSQYFLAVSVDGGQTFLANVQVSTGTSDQAGNDPPSAGFRDIDYGDYSGLAFESGKAYPAWADNSNSTGDNPDGAHNRFDVYTAAVSVVTNQPPVAVCRNVSRIADNSCLATITSGDVNNGSFDPDGPTPTCTVNTTGPFGLGSLTVTLTCVDAEGASSSCTATVTVTDATRPAFTSVPADITTATCGSLNIGAATATDNCDSTVTVTNNAPAVFPPGTTVVTWTATDDSGNSVTATQRVTVLLTDNAACCPAGTNVILGNSNNNVLTGTPGPDCILGRGGQDTINGLGGNDFISGGDGDDIINGGDGNDVIFGGSGQDTLTGGTGNDTLNGNDGDDNLQGGAGDDNLSGGQGQDLLQGQDGNDTLNGNDGDDNLQGGNGNDALIGGPNNDHCDGGAGTNTFAQCEFGAPNSCVNGVKDGTESDVDCGGSCPKCANGKACVTGNDCAGAVCTANVCQTGTGGGGGLIQASLQVTTDWGAGYCVALSVINNNSVPTTNWSVNVNIPGATTFNTWNGNFSSNTGSVNITPVATWNQVIPPGGTDNSIGFCANRAVAGSGLLPSVVSASGTF